MVYRWVYGAVLSLLFVSSAAALNPNKSLTQYSRKSWTQEQGLPQDTIRAIAQTADGFLWVATDEGLARFDGYEFVVFSKGNSALPSNSIYALAAGTDNSLWIGTSSGVTQYRDGEFRTYTVKQGLPDDAVTGLYTDQSGTLWIVAGIYLSRFRDGQFTSLRPGSDLPLTAVRHVREDRRHDLWVAGFGAVVRMSGGKVVQDLGASTLAGNIINCMLMDSRDNV